MQYVQYQHFALNILQEAENKKYTYELKQNLYLNKIHVANSITT